ncbi:tetraacyldisaccharide 4'-kinase [Pseudoalteromonas citrea]|uniref:Tetraacyldisaccharide 4'-kinase n=2 Tax=Pseudoalteromonas citrea TaxID=43655 RepID=A0AAD4AHG0_9GAMM|nr:tetraacyldisaccharide 4'-kinase [Pseudoalteromonas citrea]KAF7769773.1 tetraacyldisaccharide 4'-kinase [Pseudoalteromonas citrea]
MKNIEKTWYRSKSIITYLLLPLSLIFWGISTVRRALFSLGILKQFKAHTPIIVVGNISIGGNGKTPFALWLVEFLQERGIKVAVISRGYGSKAPTYPFEVTSRSSVEQAGDEPYLLHSRLGCPVVIGPDREASCNYLKTNYKIDLIVSDDGLQHYKMPREIELCIVDNKRRFGNGCLLPAGPLRELPSRLRSVDLVVENGGAEDISYALESAGVYSVLTGLKSDDYPNNGIAVSAIGNPQRFEKSLQEEGIAIHDTAHFRDHHAYIKSDFSQFGDIAIFMTEKDAVKCQSFAQENWYYLKVEAQPSKMLVKQLLEILKNKEIHHGL